jgi:hypothetical protein
VNGLGRLAEAVDTLADATRSEKAAQASAIRAITL